MTAIARQNLSRSGSTYSSIRDNSLFKLYLPHRDTTSSVFFNQFFWVRAFNCTLQYLIEVVFVIVDDFESATVGAVILHLLFDFPCVVSTNL
jgi:hypothetical protein